MVCLVILHGSCMLLACLISNQDHRHLIKSRGPCNSGALLIKKFDLPLVTFLPIVEILHCLWCIKLDTTFCTCNSQDKSYKLWCKLDVSYLLIWVVTDPDILPCSLSVDNITLISLESSLHLNAIILFLLFKYDNLLIISTGRYDTPKFWICPTHPQYCSLMFILNLKSAYPLVLPQSGISFFLNFLCFT